MNHEKQHEKKETRRAVLQKIAYAAPLVATMVASPAFAQTGSARHDHGGRRRRRRTAADTPATNESNA